MQANLKSSQVLSRQLVNGSLPLWAVCILLLGITISGCSKENLSKPNQGEAFVKYFGGINSQQFFDVLNTDDGGYIMIGSSNSFRFTEINTDFYLVKTDSEGNELWSKTFSSPLGNDSTEIGKVIQKTSDSGYILIGDTFLGSLKKILVVKTDASGNLQWSQVVRAGKLSNERSADIKEAPASQGGYILTGFTDDVDTTKPGYLAATDKSDVYTVKLDGSGNMVWERVRGFPEEDVGVSVELHNNSYVIIASAQLTTPRTKNFLMVNYNYLGGLIDQKNYGLVSEQLEARGSHPTSDGGIVITGTLLNSFQIVFLKLNSVLNAEGPVLALPGTAGRDDAFSIEQLEDGNYVLSGTRTITTNTSSNSTVLFVKADPGGAIISGPEEFGQSGNSRAGRVVSLGQKGFILCGTIDVGTNTMGALIKTNKDGKILPE